MGFSIGWERLYTYELTFENTSYPEYHTRNAKYNAIPIRLIFQRNFDNSLYIEVGGSIMLIMCKGEHVQVGGYLPRTYDFDTHGFWGCRDLGYGGFVTVGYKAGDGFSLGVNAELMNQCVGLDILSDKYLWENFFRAAVTVGYEFSTQFKDY